MLLCSDITNTRLSFSEQTDPQGENLAILLSHLAVFVVSTAGVVAPHYSPFLTPNVLE